MWNWHLYLDSQENEYNYMKNCLYKKEHYEKFFLKRIQEVEELKRAQQLRVDEIYVHKMRESYDTIQRLNSQMQELQERVTCMNDSGEFQDTE